MPISGFIQIGLVVTAFLNHKQTNKHNQKLVEKVQKLEIQFEKLLQFTANGIIIIKFQILPTQTIVCVYLLSFFMYDYCKFCYLIRR